jgi:large subunit ribosomal protein L15
VEYQGVNVGDLSRFEANAVVDIEALIAAGLVHRGELVKILGNGELTRPLTVRAPKFSKAAREKIEAAGGKVEELDRGANRAAESEARVAKKGKRTERPSSRTARAAQEAK